MALVSVLNPKINGKILATNVRAEVNGSTPTNVKFGPVGPVGTSIGQEKVTGRLMFAVPAAGLEIDVEGELSLPTGFSFSYELGTSRYVCIVCFRSERGVSSNPETGETEYNFAFTAQQHLKIR